MEDSSKPILSSEEHQEQSLNRRELLKILAASGGGLVAAAFLPAKWLKPVVHAGVLPAHAQGTSTILVYVLNLSCTEPPIPNPHPDLDYFQGSAAYNDLQCRVGIDPTDYEAWTDNASGIEDYFTPKSGDSCSGTFEFGFWADAPTWGHGRLIVGARHSNQVDYYLTCA